MTVHPKFFGISMFPSVDLVNVDVINSILNVFGANEYFEPTLWGNSETVKVDYDRDEIIARILLQQPRFSELYLQRNHSIEYTGKLDLISNFRTYFGFDFKKPPKKLWPEIFKLSDEIASVIKPRYGITHGFWPVLTPWQSEVDRLQKWMNFCSQPAPVTFGPCGPLGMGTRTYFSGDILNLFDKEIFEKIPAEVTEMDWGGIRIDLVAKPWEADANELLDRWTTVMDYMEQYDVFAIPSFSKSKRSVSFNPNKAWEKYLKQLQLLRQRGGDVNG
ncbi:hypothetical protein MH215_04300 [Paenibacillus sp. ACRSA]|uniref:hypothetical protein n=1 Tax=Paenibacillus sp. ACRSA TaxID=2918211 RepID=UPI001EF48989|nr:hypothetical protein [Paenibacillus sp. ACRSA]MCG7376201.1 hypothetical protein [Paenibacillus sp. ACRSA]